MQLNIVKKLQAYFSKRNDILMAFLFGSRSVNRERKSSDWDIAVYFNTGNNMDLESSDLYPTENDIRADIEHITGQECDFLVLNRARPALVFSILNGGEILSIKNYTLYYKLLSKTHYEAVDFWQFIDEFWHIREKAMSLTPEARALLIEHSTFLENEFADIALFKAMTYEVYVKDRSARRNLERWIENLVMASLDIAKIVLASDKRQTPQTYRETLKIFAIEYLDPAIAEILSNTADMRNIISHEYLDIRWERIRKFISEAEQLYLKVIHRVKDMLVE